MNLAAELFDAADKAQEVAKRHVHGSNPGEVRQALEAMAAVGNPQARVTAMTDAALNLLVLATVAKLVTAPTAQA